MTGWIIAAVYAIGYIATWRRIAWLAAAVPEPKGEDIAVGIFFSAFPALLWPILVPAYFVYKRNLLYGPGVSFLKEPGISRRERELRDREQRIAALERELGITSLDERRTAAR